MPFPFSHVCDLLQRLEDNRLARSGLRPNAAIIQEWYGSHQAQLRRDDHHTAPLLSALLPEKRTDRVYFIREKKLQIIIGRALGLGRSRIAELSRWTNPEARCDLADCVESILKQTPNPVSLYHSPVTVDEIDELLHSLAAGCRFSSPAVRSSASLSRPADQELTLGDLYRRSSARDAKWLTRLILKNYEPVVLDLRIVCAGYHPLLPAILKVQDDLAVAGRILDTLRRDQTVTGKLDLANYLKPTLGVKVGRQPWFKGRSIKHSLSMLRGRISCEEKMDGEYCQIHIDLSKGRECIQIFSKTGKDSTKDRMALYDSIRKSLQLGQPSCPLKTGCILEGELVVYSDKDSKVLDFHKIRKHVSRSGSFLGTDKDSQVHPWEHLMIVYYDVLMVDDESLLATKHSERFQRLKSLITTVPGRSSLVNQEIIDCTRRSAVSDLRRAFAKCITARGEGLVLKADDPYFDFGPLRKDYTCCAIKLKKEYIGHFGDIGDFAVVGARFDAAKARTYNLPRIKWTHFYLGCLENKDEVQRFDKQPRFVVTNVVELNAAQLEAFTSSVNPDYVQFEENAAISLRIEPGIDNGKRPSVIFPTPPVFDLRCFSFDKVGNTGFWSPRFPSVSKIHCDRTFRDAISFAELQEMAISDREAPPPDDSQELLGWIAALEKADPKKLAGTSQSTADSMTPSPQKLGSDYRQERASPSATARMRNNPTIALQAAPEEARLAPPTSSVPPVLEPTVPTLVGNREGGVVAVGRKRSLEPSEQGSIPERSKLRKCSSAQASFTTASGVDTQRGLDPETETPVPRLPVSLSMHQPESQSQLADDARPALQASQSFHAGPSPSQSFHNPIPASRRPATPQDPAAAQPPAAAQAPTGSTGGGKCLCFPDSCKLPTYSILLSPCIADFPWVAEDLLSSHGVAEFLRDPREWLVSDPPSGTAAPGSTSSTAAAAPTPTTNSAADPSGRRRSQRRKTKIALVDPRRREATVAFLQSIEAAGLKRRGSGGEREREYVPVYDWRVLEAIREEEQRYSRNRWKAGTRFEVNGAGSVWRRFWVGLA